MSLQLWLPLNGDLTNNGLLENEIIPNNLSYDNSGKIGKCGRFGYGKHIDLGAVSIGKEFSICGWFNIITHNTAWATCVQLYNSDTTLISFGTLYTTTQNYASFNVQKNGAFIFDKYNFPFTLNQWSHFCVTVKDKKVVMYVNGQISYQGDMTDTPLYGEYKLRVGNRFIGSYYPDFKLNDFRVYDHCLSPKEVKEISKGLMLHYPLDNNGMGCKNLLAGNFQSIATKEGTNNTGTLWINKESIPTGNLNYLIGKTLIFSYDVSAIGDGYLPRTSNLASRYGIHGTLQGSGTFQQYPFADYLHYTGEAKRVVMKYTIPTTMTSITSLQFALQASNYPAADNNATWYIKNCKLEIADEVTPWCPNERDELYSQLGMDENIEYDTSGYGNNGTKIGTLDYESNSPRYQSATYFNGTDAYIKAPQLTLDFDGVSFSMWYNVKSRSNWMRLFDFGNAKEGKAFTFGLGLYGEAATNLYFFGRYADLTSIDASTGYSLNNLNTWYHIACTISKGTVKVYVNGSLIKTLTLSKLPTGSQTMIYNLLAESNWSADPCSNCRISDFRIYATCLSDSDIQELYNKPISIDNQGTMFAVEAVEESATGPQFNKTGAVEATTINALPLYDMETKVLDDGSAWARILHHNNRAGTVLFTASNVLDIQTNDLYSRLKILEQFRDDNGAFEFMVIQPDIGDTIYRWKQTNNPTRSGSLSGYVNIENGSNGLVYGPSGYALMSEGGVTNNWWCAVGAQQPYNGGIPGFGRNTVTGTLDFYVRIDTVSPNKEFKIYNKYIECNDIIEY